MSKLPRMAWIAAAATLAGGANPSFGQQTGPSSSQSAYVLPVAPGGFTKSILTVGDGVQKTGAAAGETYRMVGIPDGLGAYDNKDGTFTVLMNHELPATAGAVRAHGGTGAFVSQFVINKATLGVVSGQDLIKSTVLTSGTNNFNRFCSSDLPQQTAFFNAATGRGTTELIYMTGEESGVEGRAFGTVVSSGVAHELASLGKFAWENSVASPTAQDKTVVIGTDDGTGGQVYVYVGTKTTTGSAVAQAGLTNGNLYGIAVQGLATETQAGVVAPGTRFSLFSHGDVSGTTGAALETASKANGVTSFLRPEDGAWDPTNANRFFFVTTDTYSETKAGIDGTDAGSAINLSGRTRLYSLTFDDITDPTSGGRIEALLDGSEATQMLDNITVDRDGKVLMQEDVGGQFHNGKIWEYDPKTDGLTLLARHDSARFGDILNEGTASAANLNATAPFNIDEEASGIIDMAGILGDGWFLMDVQAHYPISGEFVQGGQLLAFFRPRAVPEPASIALMAVGAAGFALAMRRRMRSA